MSRHAPPNPSGARKGSNWTPHLRQFSKTSFDRASTDAPRSPDSASTHSTARLESAAARMRRLERRCTVTVNENYSPDEVLLNLDLVGGDIRPGALVSISVVRSEAEKAAASSGHSSLNKLPTGDHGRGGSKPASVREGEGDGGSRRRYVFLAKDMSRDLKARHPHMEMYVAKHIADNFGMKKGTQVILALVRTPFSARGHCRQ